MIVTTAELFKVAYGRFAIGAYNINNMEQCIGLFQGNVDSQAPFIVQISRGARKYASVKMLEGLLRAAGGLFPGAVFAVHLDHGDEEACYDCIDSGFYSSVMIDASHEPLVETWPSLGGWWSAPTPKVSVWRPSWACWAAWRKISR